LATAFSTVDLNHTYSLGEGEKTTAPSILRGKVRLNALIFHVAVDKRAESVKVSMLESV
jgi:hypothetical protein